MEQYVKALLREIDARRAFLMRCAEPATLYIGGGTPSLCPSGWLSEIVSALRAVAGDFRELTVEVNPDDVTPEYALGLRRLGANRISMGVQSFSDVSLRWMNRRHDAAGASEAFRVLREAGFDNISLDLIFGYDPVPWGTPPSSDDLLMQLWGEDLEQMLHLRPEHISAYQMGVEDGSVLGEKVLAGLYSEPSDELCAAQYTLLQKMLAGAGYEQYEVSNFALPGRRALHNSGYWERMPYIGFGPGAHSFDGDRCRSWNVPDVDLYIRHWLPEVSPGPEIPVGTSACSGGTACSGGAHYRADDAAGQDQQQQQRQGRRRGLLSCCAQQRVSPRLLLVLPVGGVDEIEEAGPAGDRELDLAAPGDIDELPRPGGHLLPAAQSTIRFPPA